MTINAILEGAMGDLEVLGNLLDGHDFIRLEGSLICKDSNLKLLLLCLGGLLFEEGLSLTQGILEREIWQNLSGPWVLMVLSLTCPTHYQSSPKDCDTSILYI